MTKTPSKFQQSKFKGVRYREHATRKHGLKFDRYFVIRYQHNGVRLEESLGWSSAGWTEEKAFAKLTALREAAKTASEAPARIHEERSRKLEAKRLKEEELLRIEEEKRLHEKENITFKQYFEEVYLPIVKTDKKAKAYSVQQGHFNIWLEPVIGNKSFKDITSFDLERVKKNLLDSGRTPRTVQHTFATFRQVWNLARKDRNIPITAATPTSNVKIPKIDNKRDRFLSKAEAAQLLQVLQKRDPQFYNISLLAAYTGMRLGEITALTWKDIDQERGIIRILDPKSKKNRFTYMSAQVKEMFSSMKAGEGTELVFKNIAGRRITEPSDTFNKVIDELGFNKGVTDRRHKVVFHTLRHTFASWLVESGVNLYTVKELMGHSVIAMTERYSHLAPGALQAAIQVLEEQPVEQAEEKAVNGNK